MDGVVIDSNGFHYNNWNSYFEENYNQTIPKVEFGMKLGESHHHFTEFFLGKYGNLKDFEKVEKKIYANYSEYRAKIPLKKNFKETLIKLSKTYKIAIASGANKEAVDDTLKIYEITKYFDFKIGGDEVKRAKPSPEIFLKAAQGLNLNPKECVVIEDALMGLQAAKSANMKCIMVEDDITKNQDHSLADGKITDMNELIEIIKNL